MTDSALSGQSPTFIEVGEASAARKIAVRARKGSAPGLFWLGGFNSDMLGTKAVALDAWAAQHGRACVRFDYSGHGESGGALVEGTIGRWLEESVAVFERFCVGLQGAKDPDVPWQHAFALVHRLPSDDVVLTMIQDGDHRLSRPQDIARIIAAVAEI